MAMAIFDFGKRRRINKYVEDVSAYLCKIKVPFPAGSTPKFSRELDLEALEALGKYFEQTFSEYLLDLIKGRNLSGPEVYKAAHFDRRLYSKIISDRSYKPAKDTVIALIFALRLEKDEARRLLSKAGYLLSHSIDRDIVFEFFINEKIFNLDDINQVLYKLNMKTLGQ